jgi:hypothetical protein
LQGSLEKPVKYLGRYRVQVGATTGRFQGCLSSQTGVSEMVNTQMFGCSGYAFDRLSPNAFRFQDWQ